MIVFYLMHQFLFLIVLHILYTLFAAEHLHNIIQPMLTWVFMNA